MTNFTPSIEALSDSSEVSSVSSLEEDIENSSDDKDAVVPHIGYKKVLVTGGAGFIGSHVAECLLKRGDDIVIVDEMNNYYDVQIKESNIEALIRKYGPYQVYTQGRYL